MSLIESGNPLSITSNDGSELAGSGGDKSPHREKKAGRRKINIEFIDDKSRRHITFSKRKAGIMKKAYELSALTGTQVLLLVASETGHVYTFATPKLQPLITKPEGKNLIQTCLNAPDTPSGHGGGNPSSGSTSTSSAPSSAPSPAQQGPPQRPSQGQPPVGYNESPNPSSYYPTPESMPNDHYMDKQKDPKMPYGPPLDLGMNYPGGGYPPSMMSGNRMYHPGMPSSNMPPRYPPGHMGLPPSAHSQQYPPSGQYPHYPPYQENSSVRHNVPGGRERYEGDYGPPNSYLWGGPGGGPGGGGGGPGSGGGGQGGAGGPGGSSSGGVGGGTKLPGLIPNLATLSALSDPKESWGGPHVRDDKNK